MNNTLHRLMEAGRLSPLSYYFARFVARGSGVGLDSVLAQSAALVSSRNLQGDVCVNLADYTGHPLFETSLDTEGNEAIVVPRGRALDSWLKDLCSPPSEAQSSPGSSSTRE
jgi:hypothetical protein